MTSSVNNILEKINYRIPKDVITLILSYNGYYDRNGSYMKKIDVSKYENVVKILLNRIKNGIFDKVFIEIKTQPGLYFGIKILTINYGIRPIHHSEYQNQEYGVSPTIINPFNPDFDATNKLKIVNNTVFYSFITYDVSMSQPNMETNELENIYLSSSNSLVYIPYEKKKFSYYPNYPYDVVHINDNNENNKYYSYDEGYDMQHTDDYYNF